MKNLNQPLQKIKPYLLSASLLVGSILLFLAIGLTSFFGWQEQQSLLSQTNIRLADLTARKAAIDKLNSSSISLSQLGTLANGILADESSAPVVMDQVQQIAAENGVSVVALQFSGNSSSTSDSLGNSVKLQVSVSGPYENVKNFLKSIESSGRLLLVTSLHFSSEVSAAVSTPATPVQGGSAVTATLDIVNPYFSGKVDKTVDITKLVLPEFSTLANKLSSYRVYVPRVGQGAIGKQNPFLK